MGYTPMIQQYLKIKSDYQDCFLLFRMGDFYELFFEDANKAALELEITLTSRDGGGKERIPMCGVPYHSAENYIKALIDKGYKVAICEQVEDPKLAKWVVKREVVQLITPGTVMEGNMLNDKENNYLAAITQMNENRFGIAYTDLSTGETFIMSTSQGWDAVLSELYNRPIKEVLVLPDFSEKYIKILEEKMQLTVSFSKQLDNPYDVDYLIEDVEDVELQGIASMLFQYLHHTQKRAIDHLKKAQIIELQEY